MNEEEQLKLFEFDEDEQVYDDGLECNKCGVCQPYSNFTSIIYASGVIEYKRICKSCIKGHSAIIKTLKSQNAYPDKDYCCPICNRDITILGRKKQKKLKSWVLDHCHDTNTFRGWLCHHCNTGLGSFNDSLERLEEAVKYIKKHKETNQ